MQPRPQAALSSMFWRGNLWNKPFRVSSRCIYKRYQWINYHFSGGDFQICTDGNFHHKRLKSGGESIPFHSPAHIIPKEYVDRIGDLIVDARKKSPKKRTSKVPDEAIDECEEAYEAAEGDKKRNHAETRYSEMGWMSLICRHDIPLFFANIDTPGEQQKYAVALITWFSKFVPSHSTITVLYDIGCVLDRSIQMVSPSILARFSAFMAQLSLY